MNSKRWIVGYLIITLSILGLVAKVVYDIDPYFHYHKPNTEKYFYTLNNQRSQNDGISKHFEYDALITGTSMTENFKTSEMDSIFKTNSIKVNYSGATYHEINNNIKNALEHNPNLKTIVRGLDMAYFIEDADLMREDLGNYPTYLYDNNLLNDVNYLFNNGVIFDRIYPMLKASNQVNADTGITPFDEYSRWQDWYIFGKNSFINGKIEQIENVEQICLTEEDKKIILKNIEKNVTSTATEYPDVTFYYFFPPYSIEWWRSQQQAGNLYRQIEAEEYVIENLLKHDNIHLFSFNNRTDLVTDLNNYKDSTHYGEWINSLILKWMYEDQYRLTKDNYKEYLKHELEFYSSFNYESINGQEDYENDRFAEAVLREELYGLKPKKIDIDNTILNLQNASLIENGYDGEDGIICKGRLNRNSELLSEYLYKTEYIGAKISLENISDYKYLVFYGKKVKDHGQPTVYVYDKNGDIKVEFSKNYGDVDGEWHQYIIDISDVGDSMTVILQGGYTDNSGSQDSSFIFSDIRLY